MFLFYKIYVVLANKRIEPTKKYYRNGIRRNLLNNLFLNRILHVFTDKSNQKKLVFSTYDGRITSALVNIWKIFDHPCGQRFQPLLKNEIDRLRYLNESNTNDRTAE
jgi:hypothetical protein